MRTELVNLLDENDLEWSEDLVDVVIEFAEDECANSYDAGYDDGYSDGIYDGESDECS